MKEKLIKLLDYSFAKQYSQRGLLTGLHTANDLIANGVTVQEWIPVKDRLPDANKFILVYAEGIVGEATMDESDGKFYWAGSDEYSSSIEATHWMPLPEPPKGE